MKFPAIFAIIVGTGMIGQWTFSFLSKQIPELKDEPVRIAFHIAAEMATALMLIFGGIGILISSAWGVPLSLVVLRDAFLYRNRQPGLFCPERAMGLAGDFWCVDHPWSC